MARNEAAPPIRRAAPVARVPGPRPVPVPDIRPPAGHDLLAGVDAVLPRLAGPTHPAVAGIADDLRIALARTAARGDSCRVHGQAETVRLAVDLLLAGAIADAHRALLTVRAELT